MSVEGIRLVKEQSFEENVYVPPLIEKAKIH